MSLVRVEISASGNAGELVIGCTVEQLQFLRALADEWNRNNTSMLEPYIGIVEIVVPA